MRTTAIEQHHHQHEMPTSGGALTSLALSATLHCLTGCAIGEVLGMVIGIALGFSELGTVALAVGLAFLFAYGLTSLPLLRAGLPLASVVSIALAAEPLSIVTMEIVDNAVMLGVPGAMGRIRTNGGAGARQGDGDNHRRLHRRNRRRHADRRQRDDAVVRRDPRRTPPRAAAIPRRARAPRRAAEGDLAYLHVHPTEDDHETKAGEHDASVGFASTFPSVGRYRLFLQFKHQGRVHTAAFTQEVKR